MTNEEMAEILAGAYQKQYHHNDYPELSNNSEFVTSKEEIKEACMYMAAWKEKQMIEKAWQWIFRLFVVAAPFEFQQGIEKEFRKEMKANEAPLDFQHAIEKNKNNIKKISEKSPKIIAAKLITDDMWYILHLHVPNVNDRISTSYFYYYDESGEEIPVSMIEKYVILEEK